ncbi:MAG: FHA domain-containing protein [Planctomycetota bacterium]|nr:MAG: FHA domain-containing protein [Planctomycetota bacterium]
MRVVLELQDQPSNVRRISVRHDIVIGRGSDCNLRLSAPQVSRRHCFLRVGRDSVSVTDLDSSNGTYVNGARITAGKRFEIMDGAQLTLGSVRFIIYLRAEAVPAESEKLNTTAGVTEISEHAEALGVSVPRRARANDGSTVVGRAVPKAPLGYNRVQNGDSRESHEATVDDLGGQSLAAGFAAWISPASDLIDSRLEIIDFGRSLSQESRNAEESGAEPQWQSDIVDSPDDLDVLSIADGSDLESDSDREQMSDAEAPPRDEAGQSANDIVDTLSSQPRIDAIVSEQTFVVDHEFLDVDVIDEILEVADEVLEDEEESHWLAADEEVTEAGLVEFVSTDEEVNTDLPQSDKDEMDPKLKSFLNDF